MLRKSEVHALFNGNAKYSVVVESVLVGAIIASAAIVTFDSIETVRFNYRAYIFQAELWLTIIFGAEYILRLWSAPNRLRYAFSFWGLVDLLSVLPIFFVVFGSANPVKSLRLLKLARLLKLIKLGGAHERLIQAAKDIQEELFTFLILAFVAVFLSSVGIYYFEHAAQPEVFSSIPHSMWWAVVTLTTVGYGDTYPITIGGKCFTGLVLIIGLSIIAVPTGLFSTALLHSKKMNEDK